MISLAIQLGSGTHQTHFELAAKTEQQKGTHSPRFTSWVVPQVCPGKGGTTGSGKEGATGERGKGKGEKRVY